MNTSTKQVTNQHEQNLVIVGKPPLRRAFQGLFVLYAPSLLLNLLIGASLVATLKSLWARRAPTGLGRWLRPFIILGSLAPWLYLFWLRPWHMRWGATDKEVHKTMLGDELVPDPVIQSTRAVTVHAPVHQVWPWLAQLGQDRGGFYSYAWLENLAAADIHNADRIHPEWQQRKVGDIVRLSPYIGLPVAVFEPKRALLLKGWGAFVLEPVDTHTTRLLARNRTPCGWSALLSALFIELPHFIMERKMLLGIKARAEEYARSEVEAA